MLSDYIYRHSKMKKNILFLLALLLSVVSCSNDDNNDVQKEREIIFTEKNIQLENYMLASYSVSNDSEYLIVFESGLGDDTGVWRLKNINDSTMGLADVASSLQDVVIYDWGELEIRV